MKMSRCEDEKMRKCFADLHYWKNPVLRRAREKHTCVYVFGNMKINIFSPQLGFNLSEGNFLMSYRTSKVLILPFEGAKLVFHVVPLLRQIWISHGAWFKTFMRYELKQIGTMFTKHVRCTYHKIPPLGFHASCIGFRETLGAEKLAPGSQCTRGWPTSTSQQSSGSTTEP